MYDSLLSGSTHSRTKKQIAVILFSPKEKITIIFPAVQIQHGGNDCGVFVQHLLCLPATREWSESGRMICCSVCNIWYHDVFCEHSERSMEKDNFRMEL